MLAHWLRSLGGISFFAVLLAAPPVVAQQEPARYRLTLEEAIRRGLEANLRVLAAGARIEELGGTSERAKALLLPRAHIEAAATLQNRSLAAFGISMPGIPIPPVVGPFSTYDFRGYAEQPLLDLRAYHSWKAAEAQQQAARQDYQDARDQIVRFVAALYLNAQAASARVEAARARVATAEELLRLAQERHDAGVATGVDVTRAEVELADARQRLLESQNAEQRALLLLARNIGLRPGIPLELAESLAYNALPVPDAAAVLAAAFDARAEYRALLAQRSALERQRKAAEARRWPRLAVGGNYGGLGRSVGDVRGTGALQATLGLSVFDRDRDGEQAEIAARLQGLDSRIADLRLGIEQEVRDALLALESAAAEVGVAQQGLRLAERELQLARERFEAGVSSNIEVVTAQSTLARARENLILAITRHTDAKMALARAAGATEQNYPRYLNPPAVPVIPPQPPVHEHEGRKP
jgi:outer membrane protein TolC